MVKKSLLAVAVAGAALMLVTACQSSTGASGGVPGISSPAQTASSTAAPSTMAQVTVPAVTTEGPSTGVTGSTGGTTSPAPSTLTTALTSPTTSSREIPKPPVIPGAAVKATPAFGDAEVVPSERPQIQVRNGLITDLTLKNPEGQPVKGTLSADHRTWTLGEDLGYGRTYTVSGQALGQNGKTTPITGTWTTVSPVAEITTNVSPGDGAVVGVAAPIIIRFGYGAEDKALIEKSVTVTTTPKVEGAFAWIRHDGDDYDSLDWRPKDYWPADTKVHVAANMYGVKFADGFFGGYDVTSDFTIGRNQVVYADANAHNIVVKRDGETVATYEASYGSGDDIGDPNRVTRSGIHIVMDKQEHTKMSNPAYGYVNIDEYWAVRISNNGEFIHQNQGTVDAQGNTNVSHGCINLSAESAEAYFNSAIYGDPVEVTGTSVPLSAADGDIYDWAIPWSEWKSLSALASA
jgi:lipoprotein-anchoring transpeptidase ErfK/SrfK